MTSRSSRSRVSRSYACWSLMRGAHVATCGLLGEALLEPLGDLRRHHPRHVAAEAGHLAHQARRQERVLRAGGDEEGVDARELLVHLRHLELVVEVGDRPQALHDRLGAVLLGEVDEQALEELDPHVGEVRDLLGEHLLALLEREERLRLLRVADHRDDDVVEMARGPLDDVEVTVGDGIERARAQGGGHACSCWDGRPRLRRSRPPGAYRRMPVASRSPIRRGARPVRPPGPLDDDRRAGRSMAPCASAPARRDLAPACRTADRGAPGRRAPPARGARGTRHRRPHEPGPVVEAGRRQVGSDGDLGRGVAVDEHRARRAARQRFDRRARRCPRRGRAPPRRRRGRRATRTAPP